MTAPTFSAVLRALELRDVRLPAGPRTRGPAFAYGGADGERKDEAWADCPACSSYGLRVDRQDDATARVGCRQGCKPAVILAALMAGTVERRAA